MNDTLNTDQNPNLLDPSIPPPFTPAEEKAMPFLSTWRDNPIFCALHQYKMSKKMKAPLFLRNYHNYCLTLISTFLLIFIVAKIFGLPHNFTVIIETNFVSKPIIFPLICGLIGGLGTMILILSLSPKPFKGLTFMNVSNSIKQDIFMIPDSMYHFPRYIILNYFSYIKSLTLVFILLIALTLSIILEFCYRFFDREPEVSLFLSEILALGYFLAFLSWKNIIPLIIIKTCNLTKFTFKTWLYPKLAFHPEKTSLSHIVSKTQNLKFSALELILMYVVLLSLPFYFSRGAFNFDYDEMDIFYFQDIPIKIKRLYFDLFNISIILLPHLIFFKKIKTLRLNSVNEFDKLATRAEIYVKARFSDEFEDYENNMVKSPKLFKLRGNKK